MQTSQNFLTPGPVSRQAAIPVTTVTPATTNEPAERRGAKLRICTSVLQATLGIVLFVFGIIVVSFNIPEARGDFSYTTNSIDQRDKTSWGIWCSALFILTSVFGLSSKKNQTVIKLYMVASIVASFIAFCGIVAMGRQLSYVSVAKLGVEDDIEDYNNEYIFYHIYNYYFTNPFGHLEDLNQVKRALNTHHACYAIMLTCFVIEFIISIVGESFACIGLDCCASGPSTQRVTYNQPYGPQFTGHHPAGMPFTGGQPMVRTAPVVPPSPMVMGGTSQSQNIPNHAPPSYRSVINAQNSDVRNDQGRQPPPGSPAYATTIHSDGAQCGNGEIEIIYMEKEKA